MKKLTASIKIKELPSSDRLLGMVIDRDRVNHTLLCRGELTPSSSSCSPPAIAASASLAAPPSAITLESLRPAIGSLSFLAGATRPDISHAVNIAAREQSSPTEDTVRRVKRIDLKETPKRGLLYSHSVAHHDFHADSDAHWAGSKPGARSTSGDLGVIAGAAVYWSCNKQTTVAQSTSEAESIATNDSARTICILVLRTLLSELLVLPTGPTLLLVDNQVAVSMTRDDEHVIRDHHNDDEIAVRWTSTDNELVELLDQSAAASQPVCVAPRTHGERRGSQADSIAQPRRPR